MNEEGIEGSFELTAGWSNCAKAEFFSASIAAKAGGEIKIMAMIVRDAWGQGRLGEASLVAQHPRGLFREGESHVGVGGFHGGDRLPRFEENPARCARLGTRPR